MAESRTDRRLKEMQRQMDDLNGQVFSSWKDDRDRSRAGLQFSFMVSLVSFGLAFVAIGLSALALEKYSNLSSLLINMGIGIASAAVGGMAVYYLFRDLLW